MRTYQDWRLGNSDPQAAKAVFELLCELDDEDALHLIRRIRRGLKEKE